jgi:A118 family predicted phage portal protein
MAEYINVLFKRSLLPKLPDTVEKGMALGGVVMKPYHTDNGTFIDFSYQGEFVPIAFDDDDNIIDIAFLDQFTEGNEIFTKVERQTFNPIARTVVVQNKAFVAKLNQTSDDSEAQRYQLGKEVPLSSIARWSGISEEPVVIEDVIKPLDGYYKVPLANNVDFKCPMGISVFSPAVSLIKRADMQFSRLDWEYEGGQMAVDIDRNAISPDKGYFDEHFEQDQLKDRLYRRLDLGVDDTYNVFAPSLRDDNYINGLNRYLSKIEDAIGLARGTLNDDMPQEARTATEVRILKQRTYTTISTNQKALETALEDVAYAVSVYAKLYNEAPKGKYEVNIEWHDSVLSDTSEELNHRLQLKNAGVLSDVELRMWFTGEDEKTAQAAIDNIKQTQLADTQANAEAMGSANTNNSDNTDKGVKKTERDNDRKEANQKKEEKKVKDAKPQDK